MNDEEAFQAALDANPEDHTTRLVFADLLQERGDERVEGYRALARQGIVLCDQSPKGTYRATEPVSVFNDNPHDAWEPDGFCELPADWYAALEAILVGTDDEKEKRFGWVLGAPGWWQEFWRRREAEDAAALAFAKLPPARRAELLAPRQEEAHAPATG